MASKPMSAKQIRRLIHQAQNGNEKALELLLKANARQADAARKRMKSLEKAGYTRFAFKRSEYFLEHFGIKSFTTNKKLLTANNLELLGKQLLQTSKLLTAKTGTRAGYRAEYNRQYEQLRAQGVNIAKGKESIFDAFLSSAMFNEFKAFDSDRALEEAAEAINEGKTLEELEAEWEKYQAGEQNMLDAWENWTEQTPFE